MRQNNKNIISIGLTGGIGVGKSTVAKILSDLGTKNIDADKIANEVLYLDSVCSQLRYEFGEEILENDRISRKKLANIVFKNKEKLDILNEITHKVIREKIYERFNQYSKSKDSGVIVIDAPIPIKNGFIDISDEIWVVISNISKRIERLKIRDSVSEKKIMERVTSQISESEYISIADRVFYNNNDISELEIEVKNEFRRFVNLR
ncbi:MAG: dephospho-CoA kinase [Clostridiales bacterium]